MKLVRAIMRKIYLHSSALSLNAAFSKLTFSTLRPLKLNHSR